MMDATGISLASLAMSREVASRRAWTRCRKEGNGHENQAEVGGDHRRVGGTAHPERGARAHVGWRVWVQRSRVPPWLPPRVWRPADRHRDRIVLGAVLGA